jgi:S-adenosylmethionine decarboxylase
MKKQKRTAARTVTFGKHLTIDAYGCDYEALDSMDVNFKLLDELPGRIAMRKITTPYVIRALPNDAKDCGGVSGFVMIAESHISVHTFPAKKYLTMDLYSCSDFDAKSVLKIVKETYKYQSVEVHLIKRGLRFPVDNLV